MTNASTTCVCGHSWALHRPDDAPGPQLDACEACACTRYLSQHLPGQLTIGGDT